MTESIQAIPAPIGAYEPIAASANPAVAHTTSRGLPAPKTAA